MKKQPIRIGFDLDGVILYNPLRFARPVIAFIKKIFLRKQNLHFHYPRNYWERTLLKIYHKFSFHAADGFEDLIKIIKSNNIEAFIVTSRYDLFKKDFQASINQVDAHKIFRSCFYNQNDEQPHLYKERMIKELSLDLFIEDNWNIVQYLNDKCPKTKIFWISNFIDKRIKYNYKFPSLKKVIQFLQKEL